MKRYRRFRAPTYTQLLEEEIKLMEVSLKSRDKVIDCLDVALKTHEEMFNLLKKTAGVK